MTNVLDICQGFSTTRDRQSRWRWLCMQSGTVRRTKIRLFLGGRR